MEIEEHLKKFVAVGPPSELRARVVAAGSRRRLWPLLAAAATVLAMLWALNHQADRSLRAALAGGARAPRVEDFADTQLALLFRLRKEIQ